MGIILYVYGFLHAWTMIWLAQQGAGFGYSFLFGLLWPYTLTISLIDFWREKW